MSTLLTLSLSQPFFSTDMSSLVTGPVSLEIEGLRREGKTDVVHRNLASIRFDNAELDGEPLTAQIRVVR